MRETSKRGACGVFIPPARSLWLAAAGGSFPEDHRSDRIPISLSPPSAPLPKLLFAAEGFSLPAALEIIPHSSSHGPLEYLGLRRHSNYLGPALRLADPWNSGDKADSHRVQPLLTSVWSKQRLRPSLRRRAGPTVRQGQVCDVQ